MSQLLDSAACDDPQRKQDLEENDAERARIESDLAYLANQRQRDARRLEETINLERAYLTRRGWML